MALRGPRRRASRSMPTFATLNAMGSIGTGREGGPTRLLRTKLTAKPLSSGVETIGKDYDRHARAARAIAEECFDSDRVLGDLLEQVL